MRSKTLGWTLALAWVLFVLAEFFSRLRFDLSDLSPFFSAGGPAGPGGSGPWLRVPGILGSGFLVFGCLWSLGRRLRSLFDLKVEGPMALALEWGFGLAFLNLAWLGTGFLRLWSAPLGWTFLLAGAFLFLKDILVWARSFRPGPPPKGIPAWSFGVIGVYVLFLLPHVLLPETFYDSLNYFLGMPAHWIQRHGIADQPGHILSGYFHGGSLFFLNGLVLADTEGAKMLAVLTYGWVLLTVYGWARELAGPWAGAAAAAAAASLPLLYLNAFDARVDGLLCVLLLLGTYCLWRGTRDKGPTWPLAFALLAGCALSVKPSGVVLALSGSLAFLWVRRSLDLPWFRMAALGTVQVAPWLVKNLCYAGNPFYPYAAAWWGGRTFPAAMQVRLLQENQRFLPMDHGPLSWIELPWRLTMPGAGDDQFLGPILLAFLPLLFFFSPAKDKGGKFLRWTLWLAILGGVALSHMLRFSLPAFLLALVMVPAALAPLGKPWGGIWAGAVGTSAALCLWGILNSCGIQYRGMDLWSGRMDRAHYLQDHLQNSTTAASDWIGENLPKGARIRLVGDARGAYLTRPFLCGSVFDEPFFEAAAKASESAEGILDRLKREGTTHLLVNLKEGFRNAGEYGQFDLSKGEWGRLDRFVQENLKLLWSDGKVLVYGISPSPEGRRIPDPFTYFSPMARAYSIALNKGDRAQAKRELELLCAYFPGDSAWALRRAGMEKGK